ncbi:MAG TPA: ABC transporter substrate-binding protein [Casimicrobiaceae bacterium]|nr:ABC transporter substrate-binding protein [Casimicrobiaceae bacterium]
MATRPPAFPIVLAAFAIALAGAVQAADPNKVLRFAEVNINGLDPHQISDGYSDTITSAIFEALYEWDYLSRPTKLVPLAAAAAPEITDQGKTWTVRVTPGIFFTDDPAFQGKPRELVAQDFVYSIKRRMDPGLRLGGLPMVTDAIVDARRLIDAAGKAGGRFSYDAPMNGLRALDRYTIQILLTEANYAAMETVLTIPAVAREVVEATNGSVDMRRVGTGPYRLKEWKRGSRLVLEANPKYRAISFPASTNPAHTALVRSMQGTALPQIGTVVVNFIDEELPMLLEFERGKLDYVDFTTDVSNRLLASGKLLPEYSARGIRHYLIPRSLTSYLYFNVEDPVVGGLDKEHLALRRALVLGFDTEELARVAYGGQAFPINQIISPGVTGHDPTVPPRSLYDPSAAQALLDRFGYSKRDPQGYRLAPNGRALTLTLLTRPNNDMRAAETLLKKNMDAIGVRIQFRELTFQEMMKESDAGKYQLMYGLSYGGWPSGWVQLDQLYSKEQPTINRSRFRLAEYDKLYEQYLRTPDGEEQISLANKMSAIALSYAPMAPAIVRYENVFAQPWLRGFYPSPFATYWKYLDIDLAQQEAKK